MAVSVTINDRDVWGSHQVRWATVTFDASYPTGGEAVTAADFQLAELKNVLVAAPSIDDEALNSALWDAANSKILVVDAAGAQEGNTTDLSATTVEVIALGK